MAVNMQSIIDGFKDPRTLKMPLTNTPEFNNPSPTTSFPIQGRPVQSVPFPKLDRSQPHTVNYWPAYGANDPSGGVPYLPSPMPKPMGVANAPGVGNYTPYAPTPNNGGDPNRLPPGGLPFINKPPIDITVRGGAPQTASVPMPRGRPGLNIQPFDQQFNLRDPGNEGYVDPMSAYTPPAAAPQNPAVAAATGAGQGQPQTSVLQDIMTGINSLLPSYNSPRDMSRAQMYDATNAAAAQAARNQDRSGFGTDGYVRDASGNVIGRDGQYQGLTPSQMYDQISGRPTDNSFKTIGPSGNKSVSADFWSNATASGSRPGVSGPVTAGPMQPARGSSPAPKRPKLPAVSSRYSR